MQHYKYLKTLSRIPREDNWDKYRTENIKNIKNYMEGTTWNELHKLGYVTSNINDTNVITPKGLEQLRILEDMSRKDLTLISSAVAVVISLVALAKSLGFL